MPSRQCFRYGQGLYVAESKKDRSLAFKELPRLSKANEEWHYMALRFMMDKWITRDFAQRMFEETGREVLKTSDNICPVCALAGEEGIPQTKEHIMSGKCIGTRDLKDNMESSWEETLNNWNLNSEEVSALITLIRKEEHEVDLKQHGLISHGKAACLVGMWRNKTILKGREYLVIHQKCNPEIARLRMMELMKIPQEVALMMEKRFKNILSSGRKTLQKKKEV